MSSYMYILKCSDGSYYTGSTRDLEKQVQGWTRSKKEALIKGQFGKLTDLSKSTLAKHSAVGKN